MLWGWEFSRKWRHFHFGQTNSPIVYSNNDVDLSEGNSSNEKREGIEELGCGYSMETGEKIHYVGGGDSVEEGGKA